MVTATGIVLGKGAPNLCRDGRKTLCAIVLTESLGLVRVYPLDVTDEISVWSSIEMKLDRSTSDNRGESWKLLEARQLSLVTDHHEKRCILDSCVLKSGDRDPIEYQNERRKSIAMVKGFRLGTELPTREEFSDENVSETDHELQPWVVVQSQMPQKPYITWQSLQGVKHRSHIVAQEVYLGLLKNPTAPSNVFNNMRIYDNDYDKWILLGNMRDRRTVWVAVHVHRLKKTTQRTMLASLPIQDGKPAGWPYCEQEDFNAKPAAKQRQFVFTI